MRRFFYISLLLLLLPLIGCNGKPDYVIGKDRMIALLIDIHKGEAMVDIKTGSYNNDSLKNELKHSIYYKHGVNQQQFDSLMMWYGFHIDEFKDIYDEVVKSLEAEEKRVIAEATKKGKSVIEVGDSVNIWVGTPVYTFMPNSTNNMLCFDVGSDDTFEKGDKFDFSFRIFNNMASADMFIAIDYVDGSTSYISKVVDVEAKFNLKLQSDTSRVLERIYGYLKYDGAMDNIAFVDSINVIRERFDRRDYGKIRHQKTIDSSKAIKMYADDDGE